MSARKKPVSKGRKNKERGFTLVEILIALGILILVLGAGWTVGRAVYENTYTSVAMDELSVIARNVRLAYSNSDTVFPSADMAGFAVQEGNALAYIQHRIFPAITLNGSYQAATTVQDPWGGYVNIIATRNEFNNDSFQLSFDKVPQQACITIIASMTDDKKLPGLIGVSNANAGMVPTPAIDTVIPVTASAAQQTYCRNAVQAVGFTFTLK